MPVRILRNTRLDCLRRFGKAVAGATAVEFALTAPVLLLIVYGVLELGRAVFTQGILDYAVQEGSRYAAAHSASTPAEIQAVVQSSFIGIDTAPVDLTITPTTNADGTRKVEVSVVYPFPWIVPLVAADAIVLESRSSSWTR